MQVGRSRSRQRGSFHDVDSSFVTSAGSFSSLVSSVISITGSFGSPTPSCVIMPGSFGARLFSLGASRVVPTLFEELTDEMVFSFASLLLTMTLWAGLAMAAWVSPASAGWVGGCLYPGAGQLSESVSGC